ncbi:phosphatase PAP2 family protein [Streptomyces thermolineatus]|uniref:Phosphatase PAP2 family protein n=1 Tax=Streptomyces thermolineatus TaxID=44033 RepID=A0ABN3MXE4_9ACTN
MAELAFDGADPDVSLLYDINGLAKAAPDWADRTVEYVGEYGCMAVIVLLGVMCWWRARSRPDAPAAVAGVIWAPLAAAVALLINVPIRGLVERPRPFLSHDGLEVLVAGKTDFSFVSDHSTMGAAVAVGLFLVNRRLGLVAMVLAFFQGVARVYMGVHYPTDVVGGFALGTATALLLAPLAQMLLVPLTTAVSRSGSRVLRGVVVAERRAPRPGARPDARDAQDAGDRRADLAA